MAKIYTFNISNGWSATRNFDGFSPHMDISLERNWFGKQHNRLLDPAVLQPQNKSGILWKAIRVGAALYAASMVAGASVLIPYL
jgi:hypothetical protein